MRTSSRRLLTQKAASGAWLQLRSTCRAAAWYQRQKESARFGPPGAAGAAVKAATGLPTVAVGLITEFEQAEAIVGTGDADMVAIARAHPVRPALGRGTPPRIPERA